MGNCTARRQKNLAMWGCMSITVLAPTLPATASTVPLVSAVAPAAVRSSAAAGGAGSACRAGRRSRVLPRLVVFGHDAPHLGIAQALRIVGQPHGFEVSLDHAVEPI